MGTMIGSLWAAWSVMTPFAPAPRLELDAAPTLTRVERNAWRNACHDVARRLGWPTRRWRIKIRRARDPRDFAAQTKRPRFEAAAWQDGTIWLQSARTLARFGRMQAIRRHECVHAWRAAAGWPPLPVVLEEALASGVAHEVLPPRAPVEVSGLADLAARLQAPASHRAATEARSQARATVWPHLRTLRPAALRARLARIAARTRGQSWWQILTSQTDATGEPGPEGSETVKQ